MTGWPSGYGRRVLDQVDSTLNEAARIAPDLTGPTWIVARRQTGGRGRRGRRWADPAGNLAATLVLRPSGPPEQTALHSFVAALALFDACVAVTGQSEGFALKWPNDLLLNGGKLAGILLESTGQGGAVSYLAIGIGVNLLSTPTPEGLDADAVPPVSLLAETGVRVQPEAFLEAVAAAYAAYETQFVTYGFAPIRTAWLAKAARIGTKVTARTARDTVTGIFETVDAQGNLVLNTAKGCVNIPSADVFF